MQLDPHEKAARELMRGIAMGSRGGVVPTNPPRTCQPPRLRRSRTSRDFPEWILNLVLFAGVVIALIEGAMSLNAGTIV